MTVTAFAFTSTPFGFPPGRPHPRQRLTSPSRGASAVLHARPPRPLHLVDLVRADHPQALSLSSFVYSFDYLVRHPNAINESYGWHLQYLTIIGLSLTTVTVTVGLLADLMLSPQLFALKNAFSVASAPMACVISLLYWGLRAIDPRLVLPGWAAPLGLLPDLSFHAVPAIALVADLLFFSPPYTIEFQPALGVSGGIALGYWVWVEWCYSLNHFYPYPIFAMLDTPQRIGLFALAAFAMTLSTGMLKWIYEVMNGKGEDVSFPSGIRPNEWSGQVKDES